MTRFRIAEQLLMLALLCTAAALSGCSSPAVATDTTESWHYTAHIPSMPSDTLRVDIVLEHPSDDTNYLAVPPAYADNPLLLPNTGCFSNLALVDQSGQPVIYRTDSIEMGHHKAMRIIFPSGNAEAIHISYTVHFGYSPAQASRSDSLMPAPHIAETEGYLCGSYLFAWPCQSPAIPSNWRETRDITLQYTLPEGVYLYGDTTAEEHCANVYELLFHQTALSNSPSRVLAQGNGGGQDFRIVSIGDPLLFDAATIDSASSMATRIFAFTVPLFGTLGRSFSILTGINNGIGLEGMNALCVLNPTPDNLANFGTTLAHEIIHSWLGLRTGDLDMAWWKEGTTMYLGVYVAVALGIKPPSQLLGDINPSWLSTKPAMTTRSLDNPSNRADLYFSTDGTGDVIYRKGAQVCLLLDAAIRSRTNQQQTLIGLVSAFCRSHSNGSFTHAEYTACLKAAGGDEIDAIFANWETSVGVIPDSLLQKADSTVRAGIALAGAIP